MPTFSRITVRRVFMFAGSITAAVSLKATALDLSFALDRGAYQTNETIPIAVLRRGNALAAGNLTLTLDGPDGARAIFVFAVPSAQAARTEHLNVNGRLLRPGPYTVTVTADGETDTLAFDLCSHLRKSSFRVVNWGTRAKGAQHRVQGENSLGYNLVMVNQGRRRGTDTADQIRGGVDWTSCCTMSGGHQMDLRVECDWSDPYVVAQAATRRVMRDVFGNRTAGNAIGTHFYDEPGLTWWKDPATGEFTPHMVPAQVRAYEAAFGEKPLHYSKVDPANPENVRRWKQWAVWKLAFMSAAWRDAAWAVNTVRPDYIPFTQSQYGFSAFTDGYYFNVVGSLPLVSGHGGYHDWGPGYWHPSFTLDIARARDRSKPCWYMPLWYGNSTSDQTRLELSLAFATGIQGLMTPPPMDPAAKPFRLPSFDGIVASNKLMLKLGPIFTAMPERTEPVAVLYSLSDLIHEQATRDMHAYYAHAMDHGKYMSIAYLAGKLNQRTFSYVVDEDVIDGTLAAEHKALLLVSVKHLAPGVVMALKDFLAAGGRVLISRDSDIELPGATVVPASPGMTDEDADKVAQATAAKATLLAQATLCKAENKELSQQIGALRQAKTDAAEARIQALQAKVTANNAKLAVIDAKVGEDDVIVRSFSTGSLRGALRAATRFGAALEPLLQKAGINADAESSESGIAVQRQGTGDVQYTFLLNATHDDDAPGERGAQLGMKAVAADLGLPVTGAALYDAVHGRPAVAFVRKGDLWRGKLRFGPGQMRVYAQTARPIGGVNVPPPAVHHDLTLTAVPIGLDLVAFVIDTDGRVLDGAVPLRVRITDPLGVQRFDLYRATVRGALRLHLPLAANDPAGIYTATVTELLSHTEGRATFTYTPASRCGPVAGMTRRAVRFDHDDENIFRFFRMHQRVTIVVGADARDRAAAERIAGYLGPWAVRSRIVSAEAVNRGKPISADMRSSVAGLNYAPKGWTKDLERSTNLGYDVDGPVILIGNPADNPLIKAVEFFLPVTPSPTTVPGAGRGLLAYQRGALGARQESITVIAYDQAGLDEAAGQLYETLAGLKPLTPWIPAGRQMIAPARVADVPPALTAVWTTVLTDHADVLEVAGDRITVITHDGPRVVLDGKGTVISDTVIGVDAAAAAAGIRGKPRKAQGASASLPTRLLRTVVPGTDTTAALYVGGLVRFLATDGSVRGERQFSDDVLHGAWLGQRLIVTFSDGRVAALQL